MRRARTRLAGAVLACFLGSSCLWDSEAPQIDGVNVRMTFLHTTDIHSRLFPFELKPNYTDRNLGLHEANAPFGGAARLAHLLRRERNRAGRVLHLDSGDCFQGAPVFNANLGEAEIRFLSRVGLDAAVIGNHEFDAGVRNLVRQLDGWATYDVLAANYVMPDPNDPNHHDLAERAQPYAIYNKDGLRIGVIGMANLASLSSIGEGGNSLGVAPLEQNETVRAYVNMVHESVDLVVIVSHLGLTEDKELITGYEKVVQPERKHEHWKVLEERPDGRLQVFVPGVRNIDVILGGHLHVVLNPPQVVEDPDGRDVIIAHSGAFAKYLGRLDVVLADDRELGGKRVVSHKYQVFPVDDRLSDEASADVSEMLEPYLLELNQQLDLSKIIGYAPRPILRYNNRGGGDSGLGNLVADAMRTRRRVEAEFSVTNTLGMRDNFYQGPITLEEMYNVFPFENTLTVMYLSSTEVQELVNYITERSASRGCQAQAQVSGLRFKMNCGQVLDNLRNPQQYQDPGEDIRVNGEPLASGTTYKLATNDYIANGGSGFEVLKRNTTKLETDVSMRDALIDHMQQLPVCGQWELETGQVCMRTDAYSRRICADVVDCDAYIDRFISDCSADELESLPEVCREAVDAAACTKTKSIRGPFAEVPCVLSGPDDPPRIELQVADDLDTLPDADVEQVQP